MWEPKIATLVNVHEHGRTLALVAMGCNRIGKQGSIPSISATIGQTRRALEERND